jgi:hypothetical protein
LNHRHAKISALMILFVLTGSAATIVIPTAPHTGVNAKHFTQSATGQQVPLRSIHFVAPDPTSYIDEFAYISAIPSSVFHENGTQYISPLIYSSGSNSENWFLEDWTKYLSTDGGLTQATAIGDFSDTYLTNLQYEIGKKIYPRITGTSSAEIAAKIAVSEWRSSDVAVVSLAKDDFSPGGIITGNASHTFLNDASQIDTFGGTVTGVTTPTSITFTPPTWAGWLEGSFNWTGNEILTHELIDPNGDIVDYSVYSQVYFSRHPAYVEKPVPLHFWLPKTIDGLWTMNITRDSPGSTSMACTVQYDPGFTRTVSVPSNSKWLNVTLNWDNVATDLNLALVDPTGRLVMWAPAGSILANPGRESIQLPYPMEGDWTIIASWIGATDEQNNINISWRISQIPTNIQEYLESASNAAVIASLLNAPLLYVEPTQIPEITQWALNRLGVAQVWFIDAGNLQQPSLLSQLSAFATVKNLNSYTSISGNITGLSGSSDIVITVPTGDNSEFFGPAAFSAAVHGGPVFSLADGENQLVTRAQETWAPYLIGPEINNIYVVNKYENRAENGWYDERIPNKFSMMKSVDDFETFLTSRGALNLTSTQSCVVVAPVFLLPSSFDRSLQCEFNPGRIPGETPSISSILINRGLLHRYLFLTAESSDTALVSMYAYTDGAQFIDNNLHYSTLYQIENTTDALEAAGFNIESHVGYTETYEQLNSQVALWSLSTHGTLTILPRDPPDRPNGVGYFSMRTMDAPYGFEDSLAVRESPSDADKLVNPVAFPAEAAYHVTIPANGFGGDIRNIGSPIIILTACLLGGTRMPLMLMEHGAVAVTASPRTVYFQPAGMLSVLLVQSLSLGDTIGTALSNGLSLTSSDYANPLVGRDPRDYANQQILFGDPSIRLYDEATYPHVAAIDSTAGVFGAHVPGRGVASIAALGVSSYLPDALAPLMIDFDYYQSSNFSDFMSLLFLRQTVIIEPDTLSSFTTNLTTYADEIENYVRSGGIFAVLGITEPLSWIKWPISYDATGNGSTITYVESTHPLLSSPNVINESMSYEGHFSEVWSNFTIIGVAGSAPVIVAGSYGSGKALFTTTNPQGSLRDSFVENIVQWRSIPSIQLRRISQSQSIVWAGDTVVFFIQLSDIEGNPIESANVHFWLNDSELIAAEGLYGYYTIRVEPDWTTNNPGLFDVKIYASKSGYDPLSISLEQYLLIRPFPWLLIGIVGGGFVAVIIGWAYLKRRRGESFSFRRKRGQDSKARKREKEEEKQQREEDAKFDPKEYFGV